MLLLDFAERCRGFRMSAVTRIALFAHDRRSSEIGADVSRFLAWLDEWPTASHPSVECRPAQDVIETVDAVEVVLDVPGVQADAIRVVFTDGALVITGLKHAPSCEHREAAFHLAERTFGRFASVVAINGAVDGRRATARLHAGELKVRLPRIADRRGHEISIAIETA
jgi:HSP20 family protein